MTNIYKINENKIVEQDLNDVRWKFNILNGCPMASGVRPRYEIVDSDDGVELRINERGTYRVWGVFTDDAEAEKHLNEFIDELIFNNYQESYFFSKNEAEKYLSDISEDN